MDLKNQPSALDEMFNLQERIEILSSSARAELNELRGQKDTMFNALREIYNRGNKGDKKIAYDAIMKVDPKLMLLVLKSE